jgi:hypothetical protein
MRMNNEGLNSGSRAPWEAWSACVNWRAPWEAWSACVNWRAVALIAALTCLIQAAFPPGPWHWVSYLSYGPVGVIVSLFGVQVWTPKERGRQAHDQR